MRNSDQAIVLFLWLAVFVSASNAFWYNESNLEEFYDNGTKIYKDATYRWSMSAGYTEMLGVSGMKVCFTQGPELEALILGGDQNSTNETLELQKNSNSISLSGPSFTVSLWYSFRPVDFLREINDSMACDLLKFGDTSISYNGGKEYNLKYKYRENVINDDGDHPHMEFLVNDTEGQQVNRTWQWNHVAMVFDGNKLQAYYNGFLINISLINISITAGSVETTMNKLLLNAPIDGKTCDPIGFDEVTLWNKSLSGRDILALRLHVGRNRSEDETTTAAPPTTPLATTIAETTAETTSASTSESTADVITAADSTVTSSTDKTSSVTAGITSTESATTGIPPITGGKTTSAVTTRSTSTDDSTTTVATTPNPKKEELDNIKKNITPEALKNPVKITKIIDDVNTIVKDADSESTAMIAEDVENLMKTLATVVPTPNDTVEAKDNYRQAFVNLCTTVLDKAENSKEPVFDGGRIVQAIDVFLQNYVEDETIDSKQSTLSDGMDIHVTPVDGQPLDINGNTTVQIPSDAFGSGSSEVKVLVCVIRNGLQNLLEPKEGEQPTDIEGNKYSNVTAWNISGVILVMRVSGQADTTQRVQLDKPISFKLKVDLTLGELPLCACQKGSSWSGKGVTLIKFDSLGGYVECMTDHMTNFAVLMAVSGAELDGVHAAALSIISYIGCSLSLFCLFIAIILFIVLRELNSTRMGIVKNLCVALFLAQLLFVAGIQTATAHPVACKLVAALLHYFFLSVMAWMLCNGIYLYLKVKRAARPGSVVDLIYFCVLGWGVPAIVVAITAGINHNVYGTKDLCWLAVDKDGIWAFVIPAMAIVFFNAFVMVLTMKTFTSVKVFKDKTDKDKFKSGLRAMVVMLPILGLSWVFGLMAFGAWSILFQYLFAVFNSLQGVFLFIFHILLNEEVKGAMRRRFGKVGASGEENMLFNKIWAFSSTGGEKTEMSSVTQHEKKQAPVYKN